MLASVQKRAFSDKRMILYITQPVFQQARQPFGEFSVTLRKVNGSLGFAISQTVPDTTVMRHSVKALVKVLDDHTIGIS